MTKATVRGISFDHPEVRAWRDKAADEWRTSICTKTDEEQKAWLDRATTALVCTLEATIEQSIPEGELRTYLKRSAEQQLLRHLLVQDLIKP